MSDELDLAAESADATAEPGTPAPDAPPPWGDDFDADRAWKTISHLRGREKELESEAKRYKALTEDDNALREFLAEKGYELPDDDEPDPDDFESEDDPLADLRSEVQSIKEFHEAQKAERAVDAFAKHLGELSTGAEIELSDRDKQIVFRDALDMGGLTKANTEKAFKAHTEYLRSYESRVRQGWQESKKTTAPAVKSGTSATQVPDLDDPQSRVAWMQEQLANRSAS